MTKQLIMKKNYTLIKAMRLIVLIALSAICGCKLFTPTISSYDQYAYTQTTSLKVDVLNLMDSAVNDYQSQQKTITPVEINIKKLYEYEKDLPKNETTLKQWQYMMDTSGHLFEGFLVRWRKEKKLHIAFINDEKQIIGQTFDQIAELESKIFHSIFHVW